MHVHESMTKNVVVANLDTPISEILSQMEKHHIHQVPVVSKDDKHHTTGDLVGIVLLNKIITRELDPTKATAKAVMTSTTKLSSDDTLDRAAELMIGSNQRAIPVWDNELLGILSEEDMMKAVSLEGRAIDIAKPCMCVAESDGIGKIKELMVYKNISRVGVSPANKKQGTLLGISGTLDLIRSLAPGSRCPHGAGGFSHTGKAGGEMRGQRNRGYMEAAQIDKTPASNFIHAAPTVDGDTALSVVIEMLRTNEEVLVKMDGGFGIITPKDVLKAYLSGRSVALVQIVGLDREEDVLDVARIQQKAAQIIQHLSRSADLQPMKIYIKKHRKQGPKIKYSVKIELPTSLGLLIANREHKNNDKGYGQLTTVVQNALDELEHEARKIQEKFRKPDRGSISSKRAEKEEGVSLRMKRIKSGKR